MNDSPRTAVWPGLIGSAILFGLCGGATCGYLAMSLSLRASAPLAAIGLLIGVLLRWTGYRGRAAMCAAAAAAMIAFAYAQYLGAALRIAGYVGVSLREALLKGDVALTADIAWATLRGFDWLELIAAIVIAAMTVRGR